MLQELDVYHTAYSHDIFERSILKSANYGYSFVSKSWPETLDADGWKGAEALFGAAKYKLWFRKPSIILVPKSGMAEALKDGDNVG